MSHKFRERPCPTCGEGKIAIRSAKGQSMSFRDAAAVVIARDVMVPLCDRCGEMLLDSEHTAKLDQALEISYVTQRLCEQRLVFDTLVQAWHTTQKDLEKAFHLSPGYISKARKKKLLSPVLFRFFYACARRPEEMRSVIDEPGRIGVEALGEPVSLRGPRLRRARRPAHA
jgi:hypothetical protein